MHSFDYVIVTPARNEEAHIRRTLDSMVAQTRRPARWVVVDDGSTDRTGEIVRDYARRHEFIEPLSAGDSGRANFGSKVRAFHAGHARLAGRDYEYVGNLDGDVSFAPDYFERLIERMQAAPELGLAGGIIMEKFKDRFVPQRISENSVAGAVQLFRRGCYESFGGYVPMERGGIDSMAEIMARMHGWKVRTFPDLEVFHHGRVTTGARSIFRTRFNKGMINYALGYHPLFQVVVGGFRMFQPPYLVGGMLMIGGYCWAAASGVERKIPEDAVRFLRREQLARLRAMLTGPKQMAG